MNSGTNIRHLKRAQIDIQKWNACIDAAPNGLVYAYSWYLDEMCDQWDALVMDDYAAVMPIPWRKKWGIKYVCTPAFVQQLGVISSWKTGPAKYFFSQLHNTFNYGSYNLNFNNKGLGTERANFVLDLSLTYQQLSQSYATDLKNNLKKADRSSLSYHVSYDYIANIQMLEAHYANRLDGVRHADFRRFEKLCTTLAQNNNLVAKHITDTNNNVISSALLLHINSRLYLIMCTTTEKGRKVAAGHYLLDQLIREFAGTNKLLDFEGSDLPGVSHFYKNFNPQNQSYFFYHWNHLPLPVRWLKK